MIPSKEQLVKFIQKNDLTNYSNIAKHFKLKNSTVADLMDDLKSRNLVEVKKLGGSKIVMVKRGKK